MSAQGIAISLFSGAGGLDLGAEQAGYEVRAAVEWDRDAAATMEKNFGHLASPVLQKEILATPTREIMRAAGLRAGRRPDLLIGGPPCTPFSKSGFWLEWKRDGLDPDASLLQAYTRVLAEARPRRFVLENVYALTYNNRASRPAFERLLREIDAAGYHCHAKVLHAADYGVPQARPRLFIIGVPKDEPLPHLPEATHGGQWERRVTGDPGRPHITAGEALAGLVTDPETEEAVNGNPAISCLRSRPVTTTSSTLANAATPIPCSGGVASIGLSCSKFSRTSRLRLSRRSQDRTWVLSTGRAGGSASDGQPSRCPQKVIHSGITLLVVADLGGPVPSVGGQRPPVCGAAVPEASVHEDSDFRRAEHEVRGGRDARQRPGVNAIPEAKSVYRRPKRQLRLGVPTPVTLHDRPGGWCRGPWLIGRHHHTLRRRYPRGGEARSVDGDGGGRLRSARPTARSSGRNAASVSSFRVQ